MNSSRKLVGLLGILCATIFMLHCAPMPGEVPSGKVPSIKKAEMLIEHGLRSDAKNELVEIIHSDAEAEEKAEAYYLLGSIAFDERRLGTALRSWNSLVAEYPSSKHAALVKDKISELAEVVGETADEVINNVVAQSYLRHGDFWSEHKASAFTIDSSWIPNVESSIKWYDKVITEFPKSVAAKRAYEQKLRTLLGWEDPGRYGDTHGVQGHFDKYMPQLLVAFSSFEADFPGAGSLQAFRYQIAQAYWKNKDWKETREWLNRIISIAGDEEGFYKDLAERRLKNVEY